jgi:hypothetical protein
MGLGSGKNPFRIPDPGVKKASDPGSGSATLMLDPDPNSMNPDPQHWNTHDHKNQTESYHLK